MRKKILFLITLLCAVVQSMWAQNYDVWDGHSTQEPRCYGGHRGTTGRWYEHVIVVDNAAKLAWLLANYPDGKCRGADNVYNTNILITRDLDMTAAEWTPIGINAAIEKKYKSTIYGDGHTIRIKISKAKENYQGFVSYLGPEGKVEGLRIAGDIHCEESRIVGGICGENHGTIENCWVSADVSSDWKGFWTWSLYTANVGGICGENDGTIQYCCVTGNVTNNNADVGGLVGNNNYGTIKHCTFYGERNSSHSQDNKFVGNTNGKEYDLNDSFSQTEYDADEEKYLYREAIKYTYAISVSKEGNGSVRVSAGGEDDITGWHPGETVTVTQTAGILADVIVKDADGSTVSLQGHSDDVHSYWFVMPRSDVKVHVVFNVPDWLNHAGTEADPFSISSAADWDDFAGFVSSGTNFSGKYVKLTNDISVSTMAGISDHKFQGNFLGNNKTLTLNLNGTSNDCAPFRDIDGATIRDLKIAGNISTSAKFGASIAAHNNGTSNITNCHSTATINGTGSGDGTHGGFVGVNENNATLNLAGCTFTGSMTGSATDNGGFVGYNRGLAINYTYCLFAPATLTMGASGSSTFNRGSNIYFSKAYYTMAFGTAQGILAIAATTAPANLGSLVLDYGMLKAYQNGLFYDGKYYFAASTAVSLANAADNSSAISKNNRSVADVTLTDRTLYKDGKWNTICLPFNLVLEGSLLDGAVARPLTNASIEGSTLNLTFGDAVTTLVAGTPYIIKWASGDDIESPVFYGVTIDKTDRSYDNGQNGDLRVRFIGTYKSTAFDSENKSILLMGGANTLYYPTTGAGIGAQRAYFKIGSDAALARRLTAFNIDFGEGDETTGIISTTNDTNGTNSADAWFSLDGRRLDGKPTKKGVYVNNGRKVVIK